MCEYAVADESAFNPLLAPSTTISDQAPSICLSRNFDQAPSICLSRNCVDYSHTKPCCDADIEVEDKDTLTRPQIAASLTQDTNASCCESLQILQRGFDEELTLESLIVHNSKSSVEEFNYTLSVFNRNLAADVFDSRASLLSLPSPNDVRTDIISLWEEVSSQIGDDHVFSRGQMPEPARRASSGEQMPPPRRYHAYAWHSISRKLMRMLRKPFPSFENVTVSIGPPPSVASGT